MKFFLPISLFAMSLALAACGTAPATQGPDEVAAATETQPPTATAEIVLPTATQAPTATETLPPNLIQLGDLELIPFAPPWFEGDLATVVFAENGLLRIDAPASPYEPGDQGGLFTSLVFGAVTLDSHSDFDISATFNRQGGVCTGHDKCANFAATTCIVFGYFDPDNFQIFCIEETSSSWHLDAYVNGVHSYTSNSQETDAIHYIDRMIFERGLHPDPNGFRLMMGNNILYGYINGQQVFERPGYLPQVCHGENGMLVCSQGKTGDPCSYAYMEGQAGQITPGCSDLVGKIGVACFYNLPASIAAEQVAQFGFGIGWDVTNCEAKVVTN